LDPNNPNYPPGLSPQLDPTISPQAAPGAPSAPGLMSSAGSGYVMGQHEARLRTSDIAAGYAAASVTGAAEVGLRATQLFGMQSMIFGQAEQAMMASSNALPAGSVPEAAAFDKARRYGRLRQASFAFDPFSQAAAVGKKMPGWQAAGQSAARAAEQASALRALNMPAIGRGTRLAGTAMRLGMRLPGLLGGGVTFGASLAAQEAVIGAAGAMYDGHADRMKSATLVNQTAGASGVAFSQSEARGSDLTGMASRMGMDFEEFSGLTQTLSAGGNFQGVSDLQEFKSKLRGSLQQLKEIAQVTNSTLQEAAQVSSALKQQGFSGSQLPAAASQAFGLGSATGLGAGQFLQAGAMGAQYGAATNMGMSRGSSMFQQALGGVEFAMQQGKFSPEMIQRLGGSSSSATMALMQGTLGQAGQMGSTVSQMMGFIAKKGEGEYATPVIDQAKLEKLLNGGVSRQQLAAVSQSQQVLGMSTAVQRAAMPQVNQMLHATLSDGTSSPEEYLRKAEMMGIPPDTAKLIMETERNRSFTNASSRLATGTAAAQQSISASEHSGGLISRLFSGTDTVGIGSAIRDFGSSVSRNTFEVAEGLFPAERAARSPTAAGRQLVTEGFKRGLMDEGLSSFESLGQLDTDEDGFGGSGNPLSKGIGEARREALHREFETLFTKRRGRGRSRAASSDDAMRFHGRLEGKILGETTPLLGIPTTTAIDQDLVESAVRHRQTFDPSSESLTMAGDEFARGNMTTSSLLADLGIGGLGTLTMGRRSREELTALSAAKRLRLRNDKELAPLIEASRSNRELTDAEALAIQNIRGEVHATAGKKGFSAQGLIGADLTAASGLGMLSGDKLAAALDDAAGNVAGEGRAKRTGLGVLARLAMPVVTGAVIGDALDEVLDDSRTGQKSAALKDMLTGEGRNANIASLGRVREERERLIKKGVGVQLATARAIETHMDGLTGDARSAVADLMADRARLSHLDTLERGALVQEYQRIVDPIAESIAGTARSEFADGRRGSFEFHAARRLGNEFGAGRTASERSEAMAALMDVGLRGDGSLTNEANKLRKAGLRDVAALFSTVEALAGGGTVKDFTEDEVKAIGGDRNKAIDALKKKGMLSGIAGAQAQASADSSLQGRSLAGDLLAFSNMTKDLVTVVQHIVDETGVSIPKTQMDASGMHEESAVDEDGTATG
jgi:hypothetical protein